MPEYQDLLLDEERRPAFSIVSLAFKENNKWRLTDRTEHLLSFDERRRISASGRQ